jgi:twitching motility protein PilI
VLDFDLPLAHTPPAAARVPTDRAPAERAQAVRCGDQWFAFPYGWARTAVEQAQLSAVPGAPRWLAGAANVEGRIVPVIDLMAWNTPGRFVDLHAKDVRLLVGGEDDDTVAVLFEGLPRLVSFERKASRSSARIAPYVIGAALHDDTVLAIDPRALVGALIDELAL